MSLEEQIAALTDAITALTDSNHHLASAYRGASAMPAPVAPVPKAAATEGAVDPKPRGRPKAAPPSPAEQAAASLAVASTTPASQASAPAAASGSKEPELTYADLAEIVPKVAEKHGRSKAVEIFATFGVSGGKQLLADKPAEIPAAVRAFRAALG